MRPHKVVRTIWHTTGHHRQRCIEPWHVGDSRRSLASRGFDQRGIPGAYIRRGCHGSPATAEGSIQLHDTEQFVTLETGEVQLGVKQVALGIEHLQVGIEAPKKTLIGEPRTVLECPDQ